MPFLELFLGLTVLLVGGEALVTGSVGLSRRFGVPPLLIGLTVVAMGTSSPELAVTLTAVQDGQSGLALGNIIGSNICNIGLILGLVATFRPLKVQRRLVVREVPILLVVVASVLIMLSDGVVSRWEGAILLTGLVLYLALAFRGGRNLAVDDGALQGSKTLSGRPWLAVGSVIAGIAALYLGGEWLISGAVGVARLMGMSEALIGVTIVAFGTSMPELAASLMALRSGEADLAVGNVVGSNLFNLLAILGIGSVSFGMPIDDIRWSDLGFMAALTLLLYPMIVSARKLERWEGIALLTLFLSYNLWMLLLRPA